MATLGRHNLAESMTKSSPMNGASDPAGLPARWTRAALLAARFLFPVTDRSACEETGWPMAGRWLLVWGIIIGAAYALVFRGAWRWFGEYNRLRLAPVAVLLALDLGWCGRRLLLGALRVLGNDGHTDEVAPPAPASPQGTLALVLIAIFKYALLLSLPFGARLQPADWRDVYLGFFYPEVIYRPLILMPIWGRWAIMLALRIGRVAPTGSQRLRLMAGGLSLSAVMLWWLGCSALTMLYCSGAGEHLARGVFIAVAVFLTCYLVCFALARRAGGQTEATVGAAGLVGELAFLMFYLPVARAIYWY